MRNNFWELLLRQVLLALTGISLPGNGTATNQVADIWTNLLSLVGVPVLNTPPGSFDTNAQLISWVNTLIAPLGILLPTNIFDASGVSGSNLVIDSAFEDTTIARPGGRYNFDALGTVYSTDFADTGTHSLKMTVTRGVSDHNSDNWLYLMPFANAHVYGGGATDFVDDVNNGIRVQPGQKFKLEAKVYKPNTNTSSADEIVTVTVNVRDSKGVNAPQWLEMSKPSNTITANTWVLLSGDATIPAGYDRAFPMVEVYNYNGTSPTTPNVFYWDTALVREETQTQNIIEQIVTKLFGGASADYDIFDAALALLHTNAQIAANAAAIQALATQANGQQNSGNAAIVSFADFANGSLPGSFTVNYSGAGTSTEGIIDGLIQWTSGSAANRTANNIYNALQTLDDYQVVGTSWAYGPENFFGSLQARGRIICRSNSGGTSYVYLDVFTSSFDWYFELGCVVSGVTTVMKSATQFATGFGGVSSVSLAAGTVVGNRVFAIYSGNTLVYTHTEIGTTSQLGASFRYTGFGGDYIGSGGTSHPPTVNQFAMSDNKPPPLVGSGARMYRTGTGTVNISNGVNLLPTNFFSSDAGHTSDITVDLVNGSFAVYYAGWYRINTHIQVGSGGWPNQLEFVLHVNGSPTLRFGVDNERGVNSLNGLQIPRSVGASISVPLATGDFVQIGYDATSAVTGALTGEASGNKTYFAISLENRSLA